MASMLAVSLMQPRASADLLGHATDARSAPSVTSTAFADLLGHATDARSAPSVTSTPFADLLGHATDARSAPSVTSTAFAGASATASDDGAPPATSAPERTWLGWLSGFVAVGLVLGASAGAVLVIRQRRSRAQRRDP